MQYFFRKKINHCKLKAIIKSFINFIFNPTKYSNKYTRACTDTSPNSVNLWVKDTSQENIKVGFLGLPDLIFQ